MPYITVESGALSDEQKEELIKRLTEVSSEIMKVPQEFFVTTIKLVSKKFALLKKPVNPSRFRTHPAVPELSALCIILAVFLKGGKNVSADSA